MKQEHNSDEIRYSFLKDYAEGVPSKEKAEQIAEKAWRLARDYPRSFDPPDKELENSIDKRYLFYKSQSMEQNTCVV